MKPFITKTIWIQVAGYTETAIATVKGFDKTN